MKITTALNHRDRGKQALHSLYHMAVLCHMPSDEIHKRSMEITNIKGAPYWVKAYLDGVESVLRDNLYRYHLEFCYTIDGKLYSVNRGSDRYYEKFGITPSELNERQTSYGHYYIGSDKHYFKD